MTEATIINIDIESRRGGCDDISGPCLRALQLAKSGQLLGVVIIGLLADGKRFQAKWFQAEDSSVIIGDLNICLHQLCRNQIDGPIDG